MTTARRVAGHVHSTYVFLLMLIASSIAALAVTPIDAAMRVRSGAVEFGVDVLTDMSDAALRHVGDHTIAMDAGGVFNASVVAADAVHVRNATQLLVDRFPLLRNVRVVQSTSVPNYQPRQCCTDMHLSVVPGLEVTFTPVEGRVYTVDASCRLTTENTASNSGPQNYVSMYLALDSFVESSQRRAHNWANEHVVDQADADYGMIRLGGTATASELLDGAPVDELAHTFRIVLIKALTNDLFAQYCALTFVEFPDVLLT